MGWHPHDIARESAVIICKTTKIIIHRLANGRSAAVAVAHGGLGVQLQVGQCCLSRGVGQIFNSVRKKEKTLRARRFAIDFAFNVANGDSNELPDKEFGVSLVMVDMNTGATEANAAGSKVAEAAS